MSQDTRENFGVKTRTSIGAWRGRAVGVGCGGGRRKEKKRQKGCVESQIK